MNGFAFVLDSSLHGRLCAAFPVRLRGARSGRSEQIGEHLSRTSMEIADRLSILLPIVSSTLLLTTAASNPSTTI
jgi:hypothetical protein